MRRHLMALMLCTAFALAPAPGGPALAQETATLVADRLEISGDSRLVASGSVEVFHEGRRMTASRVTYDQTTDRLLIEGPIRLTDATGGAVIVAAQADLAADLTEGLLQSARLVLDQQLQVAAAELRRSGGRYVQMDNAVASSCRICAGSSTPLWEIRARRVLHDTEERQIYFDRAQLRVAGVPVLFVPRLRMPDPTLDRSSGFLQPSFTAQTSLGTGITLPYFLTLGPSRDLTFSPSVTTNGSLNLGLRYRQAFDNGSLQLRGAIARDALQPGEMRGYAMADGSFHLGSGYRLAFHIETVSDDAYLADYGISTNDRITNTIQIDRVQRRSLVQGRIINFVSLRDGELGSATPYLLTDATYVQRFSLGALGGDGMLRFGTHTHTRRSSIDTDSPADGDDIAEGADMGRISIGADWRRDWIMPGGIVAAVLGETRLDSFEVRDDAVYGGAHTRIWGAGAVELRWPWLRATAAGQQVLEPIMQLAWASGHRSGVPNEDSRLVDFDEGNLFSLNRFPGNDAVETGRRLTLGLSLTQVSAEGWSIGLTGGRVFRSAAVPGFSAASGLDGSTSDWMIGATLESPGGLQIAGRMIAQDDLTVTRGEVHAAYVNDRLSISTGYITSIADTAEDRADRVDDIVLAGSYQFTPNWSGTASGRYDFGTESPSHMDLGLSYRNECVSVALSVSRRFTSSTTLQPSTTVDLSLGLLGFGNGGGSGPARVCRR